jgi:hypothetical protein
MLHGTYIENLVIVSLKLKFNWWLYFYLLNLAALLCNSNTLVMVGAHERIRKCLLFGDEWEI